MFCPVAASSREAVPNRTAMGRGGGLVHGFGVHALKNKEPTRGVDMEYIARQLPPPVSELHCSSENSEFFRH